MPVIKTFIRSLAQAFGISSPQQARQVARTWTPPSEDRSETDPEQPTAPVPATKKVTSLEPLTRVQFSYARSTKAWVC
jgi:hypothetical protein